jgi:PHP family Zn ribbon phosphoesterase
LRRPLRFVFSTEVCCAPVGTPALGGLHHLIYFSSAESVLSFRTRVGRFGDLGEGRPSLDLSSRQLLELVVEHGEGAECAPAHIFNPWYSALGTVSGGRTLDETFGEFTPRLFAAETGLTSTPPMCRRVSALDRHALFCCSDAHSLENIGREHMLLEIEPGYAALFAALREGAGRRVRGMVKFPIERARYFPNWCGLCHEGSFERRCPHCHRTLVTGSRDRLELIADRREPVMPEGAPPFQQLLPLAYVLAELMGVGRDSKSVMRHHARLLEAVGNERHILTEAQPETIADASTPQLARAIVAQRTTPPRYKPKAHSAREDGQFSLGL